MAIPFEFVVDGPPVSAQGSSRGRAAWQARVLAAAAARWPAGEAPCEVPVAIRITHFYDGTNGRPADVDNIIKPIQDALKGLVYLDDHQVADTRSRRRDISGAFRIRGLAPEVAVALALGREFLHIQISVPQPDEHLD